MKQETYYLWVNLKVEAESLDDAYDYAFEAMTLAEGQGLMDHRTETLKSWSIEGPEETFWTTCGKCEQMNIEIIDDSAPEFCNACE
jgi:hypothetical protein